MEKNNYESFISINFIEQPELKNAFTSFEADRIIQRLSYYHPEYRFIENDTLILFDEIQAFMDATTALKFFKLQGKYDVICSSSELGIHNQTISSAAVGFKEEKVMHALDFEEFLWAKGYPNTFAEEIIEHMVRQKPFDTALLEAADELFMEYILVGGYPRIVDTFVQAGNYSNILDMQKPCTEIIRMIYPSI